MIQRSVEVYVTTVELNRRDRWATATVEAQDAWERTRVYLSYPLDEAPAVGSRLIVTVSPG